MNELTCFQIKKANDCQGLQMYKAFINLQEIYRNARKSLVEWCIGTKIQVTAPVFTNENCILYFPFHVKSISNL